MSAAGRRGGAPTSPFSADSGDATTTAAGDSAAPARGAVDGRATGPAGYLTCAWCDKPATGEAIVAPARYGRRYDARTHGRVLLSAERKAPACDACRARLAAGEPIRSVRRRGQIPGQTDLYEQIGAST